MDEFRFFNNKNNLFTKAMFIILIAGMAWFWFGISSNSELDPLVKTVAITIVFFASLFLTYSLISVNHFFIDSENSRVVNKKGIVLFNKNSYYPFSQIRHLDLRFIATTLLDDNEHSAGSTATIRTTYYAVLVLKDNEVYIEGSTDENETKMHVKNIAKAINKPFYVNYNKAPSKLDKSEFNFTRVISLLACVLLLMFGLFKLLS